MKTEKEKKSKSREYGFLAQEVQQLYPDLVLADDDGYLSVNYNGAMNEAGTNIPVARIFSNGNTMKWDDGNAEFSHYILVLATEYRLLKNYHQDYSRSARELYYQERLKSFVKLSTSSFTTKKQSI